VILFCDDAAGSHIGVVCYEPGCESSGETPGPWQLYDRFWQEDKWASDVTAFAWDPNGQCLYVSTSGIYGSGDMYALNLVTRHAVQIPVDTSVTRDATATYATHLRRLDAAKHVLTVSIESLDNDKQRSVSRLVRVPACGD
jgi:hypothetical protein